MTDQLRDAPKGWELAKLGEILEPSQDRVNPSEIIRVPYIGLEHIEKDTGKLLNFGYSNDVRSLKARFFAGDLLYGKLRPYLNKVYFAEFDGVCSTDILVFSNQNNNISNKYLSYRLLCEDFVRYANLNTSGVQHPRVDFKKLANFIVPIAPLPEQHRIVARIEELFSRLDAGVEALRRARAQLQRYRQSVLKAAVEGRLTAEWRAAHPEVEPAGKLIEKMLDERRIKWEEKQIYKFRKSGKKLVKNLSHQYQDPISPEPFASTSLPTSWGWATAEQCAMTITDGEHITPERSNSGVLLLSARNIQDGYLSLDDVDYVPERIYGKLKQRLLIESGDVLLSCSGSVGRSCTAPDNLEFALVRSVAVLKPILKMGEYLSYALRSPLLQAQINSKKTQTAQANIFQSKIRTLLFPLPPIKEQEEMVRELDLRFSIAEDLEVSLNQNLNSGSMLRQSILKRAFEGRLVPQDPNDEPASILLERIGAERTKPSPPRGRRRSINQASLIQ